MTPLHYYELTNELDCTRCITIQSTVDIVLRSTNKKVYSGRIVSYDHDRFVTADSVYSRKQYSAFANLLSGL